MPAFILLMCRSVEMESGMKPCFIAGTAMPPGETAAAMSDIEDDAALAPLDHARIQFARIVELVRAGRNSSACRYRRAAVSWSADRQGTLRMIVPEIDHHRDFRQGAGFHGVLHRRPLGAGDSVRF